MGTKKGVEQWHKRVPWYKAVPCPLCGKKVGEGCYLPSGQGPCHSERVAAYQKAKMSGAFRKVLALVVLALVLRASAQDMPDAPSKKSLILPVVASVGIVLDSWTTSWIKPRWDHDPHYAVNPRYLPCTREGESPWLYGSEPTQLRSWSVGAAKLGGLWAGELIARRHHRRSLWVRWGLRASEAYTAGTSWHGAINNFAVCR